MVCDTLPVLLWHHILKLTCQQQKLTARHKQDSQNCVSVSKIEPHALLQIFPPLTEYCLEKKKGCYLHNMQYTEHMAIVWCEQAVATYLLCVIDFYGLIF